MTLDMSAVRLNTWLDPVPVSVSMADSCTFSWSEYNASKDPIGTFTSTFTSAVLEAKGVVSNGELHEDIRQRVVAEGGSVVQLWISDGDAEAAASILDDSSMAWVLPWRMKSV
ncbi:unnamed protein product [Rhizoctonia solani]|uniref:Uncharacterized protein n=1 Tax=Rhizoctonia solani TaxID=456999 RepID=A0A8H2XYF5_9AGAM|nr:unnamed protein product [Rhizoctonia solani]